MPHWALCLVRPVLEYANVVWDKFKHYEKEELGKYRMRMQELLQALPNLFLYKFFMNKSAGTILTRDVESTNLQSVLTCAVWPP